MKVTGILADAVAVADGKLYVHGGGWHVMQSVRLPAVIPNLGVGLMIAFSSGELASAHRLSLRLRDADGQTVPLANDTCPKGKDSSSSDEIVGELSATVPAGDEAVTATILLAFNVQGVTLDQDAPYELEIAIDDEVRERLPLAVRLVEASRQ